MRVVHIAATDQGGGADIAAWRLTSALRAAGLEATLLVGDRHRRDTHVEQLAPPEALGGLPPAAAASVQRIYADRNRTELTNTHFSIDLGDAAVADHPRVRDADVIHLHWVSGLLDARGVGRLIATGKPVVWTLHDFAPFTGGCHFPAGCEGYRHGCEDCPQLASDPFGVPAATLATRRRLWPSRGIRIVSPSDWMAARARESAVFGDAPIAVIPNAVDTKAFRPRSRARARAGLGLPPEATLVLCGSRHAGERRKGLDLAAGLWAGGDSSHGTDGLRLLWVGDEGDASAAGPGSDLRLGRLEGEAAVARAFNAADLFALPSLEDHAPNMIIEAMASGLPTVAFDVGAAGELLGEGGRLIAAGDGESMKRELQALAAAPRHRRRTGKAARAAAEARHGYPVVAEAHIDLYERALAAPREPSLISVPGAAATPGAGATERLAVHCMSAELEELRGRRDKEEAERGAEQAELDRRAALIDDLDARLQASEAERMLQGDEIRLAHEHLGERLRLIQDLDARVGRLASRGPRRPGLRGRLRRAGRRLAGTIRADNWWATKIPPLLGIAYLEILRLDLDPGRALALLAGFLGAIVSVAAYGHVLNDICDVDDDARAGHPNVAASMSPAARVIWPTVLAATGFASLAVVGTPPVTFALLALNYVWPTIYSLPFPRLKERGVLGILTDAAGAHLTPTLVLLTLFAGDATAADSAPLFLAAVLLAASASGLKGIIHHQMIDREADRRSATSTFAGGVPPEQLERLLPRYNLAVELPIAILLVASAFGFCPAATAALVAYGALEAAKYARGFEFALAAGETRPSIPFANELFYVAWLPLAGVLTLTGGDPVWAAVAFVHVVLFSPGLLAVWRDFVAVVPGLARLLGPAETVR